MHKQEDSIRELVLSPQLALVLETPVALQGLDDAERRAVTALLAQMLREAAREVDAGKVEDDQA